MFKKKRTLLLLGISLIILLLIAGGVTGLIIIKRQQESVAFDTNYTNEINSLNKEINIWQSSNELYPAFGEENLAQIQNLNSKIKSIAVLINDFTRDQEKQNSAQIKFAPIKKQQENLDPYLGNYAFLTTYSQLNSEILKQANDRKIQNTQYFMEQQKQAMTALLAELNQKDISSDPFLQQFKTALEKQIAGLDQYLAKEKEGSDYSYALLKKYASKCTNKILPFACATTTEKAKAEQLENATQASETELKNITQALENQIKTNNSTIIANFTAELSK
ncbi:MAG: hypothetical protein WCJ58_03970 [bacterium]